MHEGERVGTLGKVQVTFILWCKATSGINFLWDVRAPANTPRVCRGLFQKGTRCRCISSGLRALYGAFFRRGRIFFSLVRFFSYEGKCIRSDENASASSVDKYFACYGFLISCNGGSPPNVEMNMYVYAYCAQIISTILKFMACGGYFQWHCRMRADVRKQEDIMLAIKKWK